MRTHPRTAPLAVLRLTAAALAATVALTMAGLAPAGAHSRRAAAAAPTADNFARLRDCESDGDYGARAANRYFGAYQFSVGTWRSLGYGGLPNLAAPLVQDEAARRLQARSGWRPWPACSRLLGLR